MQNVKLPYKYRVRTRLLLYAAVHPGIHHVCDGTHTKTPQITSWEHHFHILCYIFDSDCNIHKQHYLSDINSWRLFKRKDESSTTTPNKNKVRVRNIYCNVWSLPFAVNGQDWGAYKIVTKIKHKERPCNRICYTPPLSQSADHYRVTSKNWIRWNFS